MFDVAWIANANCFMCVCPYMMVRVQSLSRWSSRRSPCIVLPRQAYRDSSIDEIVAQIQAFLERCAHETESAALRSLLPGCIAQPKYKSFNDGKNPPIELRVTALWGRAHSAVWWWGDTALEMNTWFSGKSRVCVTLM